MSCRWVVVCDCDLGYYGPYNSRDEAQLYWNDISSHDRTASIQWLTLEQLDAITAQRANTKNNKD
jgi:hypothetical protein